MLLLLVASAAGLKGRAVTDYRASDWLPLFAVPDATKDDLAEARKGVARLRQGLRALTTSSSSVKRKAKGR